MEYEFVPGIRLDSKWLFVFEEKFLYKQVNEDKNGKRFKCIECDARITIRLDGTMVKGKKSHDVHAAHEVKRNKQLAMRNIKAKCSNVAELCGTQKVSIRDIFDKELKM